MELTLKNAIELLAAFQAFLFAVYLLVSKNKNPKSTVYIAVFLILIGINSVHYYFEYLLDPISTNLSVFFQMSFFMMPASLFFYTKSSLFPGTRLQWKDWIHLLPFILVNIVLIPTIYAENLKENPLDSPLFVKIQIAFYFLFYLLIAIYQVLSFRLLKKNKLLYVENYSNTDIRRYRYLYALNIIFTVTFFLSMIKNVLVFNTEGMWVDIATNFVRLALLVFFCWIIFKGLQYPELFNIQYDETLPPVKDLIKQEKTSGGNISISSEDENKLDNELVKKVKDFMESDEPYLDASLSLNELARKMKIPSRDLSILINHHLNKHFFDFVNEYRINKAAQLLTDPNKNEFTVLEILYEVGFNSKSSFNTAFKKQTGFTPTEYRKKHSLSAA